MSRYGDNEMCQVHSPDCQHTRTMEFRSSLNHKYDLDVSDLNELADFEAETMGLGWPLVIYPCTGLCTEKLVIGANENMEAVDQNGVVYYEGLEHPDGEDVSLTY